ncbi:MAG TPA: class I SAM-dependent methyltransferase [Acidimicrobiales bacterium]|nr:class I SAM-dependent methyltransferase [Acidimicrobiales bacterium]
MTVEFGRTADDYATHRVGFPPSLFDRLASFGLGKPGQSVVDVGTGTGTLARGFALRGCRAVGVDPAPEMLEKACQLDREVGVHVEYRVARAEATGLEGYSYDVLSAGQCWHWFDRPSAAQEARRLLRAGGAIVICHFDWLPLPASVAEATEAAILRHNPHWGGAGGSGMYPRWATDVAAAGFGGTETFSYDVDVAYTHEAWRGRIRASSGVAASLSPQAVRDFDADHAGMLAERFPNDTLHVPHRVWALVARS